VAEERNTRAGEESPSRTVVQLPFHPHSQSELLSANHIFTVEVVSLQESPWSRGTDGLEHRQLNMNLKLLETFKGVFDIPETRIFPLKVQQRRESEYSQSEFYGLWSQARPEDGTRYIVFANASSNGPGTLMQDGNCQRLEGPEYIPDVRLAIQAENAFQQSVSANAGGEAQITAAYNLLHFSEANRSHVKDLFARYLWAQVSPVLFTRESNLVSEVLKLAVARDANIEFRAALISDLYDSTVERQPDPELTRRVLRSFFSILAQPEAASLQSHLIEVELYGLAFQDGKPDVAAESVLSDSHERQRMSSVVAQFDSERARALSAWLSGGK
jgi:hypothetical protein